MKFHTDKIGLRHERRLIVRGLLSPNKPLAALILISTAFLGVMSVGGLTLSTHLNSHHTSAQWIMAVLVPIGLLVCCTLVYIYPTLCKDKIEINEQHICILPSKTIIDIDELISIRIYSIECDSAYMVVNLGANVTRGTKKLLVTYRCVLPNEHAILLNKVLATKIEASVKKAVATKRNPGGG